MIVIKPFEWANLAAFSDILLSWSALLFVYYTEAVAVEAEFNALDGIKLGDYATDDDWHWVFGNDLFSYFIGIYFIRIYVIYLIRYLHDKLI